MLGRVAKGKKEREREREQERENENGVGRLFYKVYLKYK
jgi:hypothetical protein